MLKTRMLLMIIATAFIAVTPAAQAAMMSKATSGAAAAPPKGTFVGKVAGTRAYIALVNDGKRVGGYVCDNSSASKWMTLSPLRNGRATLKTRDGTTIGSVLLNGRRASGTIKFAGRSHRFSATKTTGKKAGLHHGTLKRSATVLEGGWIVLADGTRRGSIRTVDKKTGKQVRSAPAASLDPTQGDVPAPGGGVIVVRLVVIAIIAILIGLLIPAVQKCQPNEC